LPRIRKTKRTNIQIIRENVPKSKQRRKTKAIKLSSTSLFL
jgi:hypothetical protein